MDLQTQLDIAARLSADPLFSDVAVLVQRKGVTASDVETALSTLNVKTGKGGVAAIVLMPTLVSTTADAPGPEYSERFTVQVIETPMLNLGSNGTGKAAEQICKRVRKLLHRVCFGGPSVFVFDGQPPDDLVDGNIGYSVNFRRRAQDESEPKLPEPEISSTGSGPVQLTATSVDPAAAIWYSVDGSYPEPSSATASLYAGPVEITTASTLRAVAYRSGFLPSNVAAATISFAP